MSWGDLSCKHFGNCKIPANIFTCNSACKEYIRKENLQADALDLTNLRAEIRDALDTANIADEPE